MLWAALLPRCLPGTPLSPGLLMGNLWGPARIKKWFLNTNHREIFSSVSSCGTKPGNLCVLERGCYKWVTEAKQKKINRRGSRLGVPVILVLGRWRQEEQEFKVILGSFSYFFHYFVGSSPYCLLSSPPQWSPICILPHLFFAPSSPLQPYSVFFLPARLL